MSNNSNGDKDAFFNLKLKTNIRDAFKETTKKNHVTMQDVLAMFVAFYIENPQKFRIKKLGVFNNGEKT